MRPDSPAFTQAACSQPAFEPGEMISPYELAIAELVREILGNDYWYTFEFPLQLLCNKRENAFLPKELWQFWVNSRVDIAVMSPQLGPYCRQARLLIECQSHFHDWPDVERRDRLKAKMIHSTGIPLIYVRYADYGRILRFWSDTGHEVLYNPFTRSNWEHLNTFLKQQL